MNELGTASLMTIPIRMNKKILNDIYLCDKAEDRHFEGNSAAHLKARTVLASQTVIIHNGKLLLGRWQGIYFCEFDGPRSRSC